MNQPLEGLTVLDFTRVYSGPFATLMLADMGARVIKVEHPCGGDDSRSFGPFIGETSGYFETVNRGKRSIAVDYRNPRGQQLLRQLASQVDVVAENFRAGCMARYGLDYPTLSQDNPGLIYVSITGFGQRSAYNGQGCYDIVAQAMSGLMSMTGTPEQPFKTGPSIADAISGLTAAAGLLAALWQRERTGQGAHIDISMVDAVFACLENALATYSMTGEAPQRLGNADTVLAPFDSFQTVDGWVVIGVGNDRLWRSLAKLLHLEGDSRFDTNGNRVANYSVLRPLIADWCSEQPVNRLLTQLHAAGIPSGPIRAIDELATDSDLEARGMLAHVQLADGKTLTMPGRAVSFLDCEPPSYKRGPRLGEHTQEILSGWLGLDDSTLVSLQQSGVISLRIDQESSTPVIPE